MNPAPRILAALLAAALAAVGAPLSVLADDTPAASAATTTAVVGIDNFAFTPAELKVKAGTTVTFVNHDDIPHSIVGAGFHSRALDTDERFSYAFTSPGEYDYFCGLHPHMKGKIVVTP